MFMIIQLIIVMNDPMKNKPLLMNRNEITRPITRNINDRQNPIAINVINILRIFKKK